MFESLFRAETPLAVQFLLAFIIVAGLLGVTALTVRRFGRGRLGGASTRQQTARLAVVGRASISESRQIILVRRDNVEHLLMIGGPSDIVVEASIARAVPPADDAVLPRAIPLPEIGLRPSQPVASWSRRAPQIEPIANEPLIATSRQLRTRSVDPSASAIVSAAEQSHGGMIQRSEAAMRKVKSEGEGGVLAAPTPPDYAAEVEAALLSLLPPLRGSSAGARSARAEQKTKPGKALYESLKQQMASLLDSPAGKA